MYLLKKLKSSISKLIEKNVIAKESSIVIPLFDIVNIFGIRLPLNIATTI